MRLDPAPKAILLVDRWLALVLGLVVLVASGPLALADDYVLEQDVMVPMRDGVLLATDIYRPAKDGVAQEEPLPVILTRLPYNKNGAKTAGAYYASRRVCGIC